MSKTKYYVAFEPHEDLDDWSTQEAHTPEYAAQEFVEMYDDNMEPETSIDVFVKATPDAKPEKVVVTKYLKVVYDGALQENT